jgi:outer membrane protein TolC
MPAPTSSARWRGAAAAAALACVGGCALSPSRSVDQRVAAPGAVAREVARTSAEPLPPPAPAPPKEAAPPPAPRSLSDLVDLALTRDPATRAAWRDARVAAAQAGSTHSVYFPALDASTSVGRQRTAAAAAGSAPIAQSTWSATVAVTWLLLDLGTRSALVDEADRLLVAARLGEHAAVADLVLQVQQSYFEYLAARALVEAQAATVKQAETSLAFAEGRQRAGLATIADVLQARTALSQARLVQQQVEGQALVDRGALATLAGLPPTAELEVGELPASVAASEVQPAVDDLLAAAAARNPDLGRARAAADAAASRARAASRALWPTLSFQGSATRTAYLAPSSADAAELWSARLVLALPTFEGLRPAYDALAARESAEAARERADATAQRVALDVWTSWQALRTAGRRVATARDLVESARLSVDVAAGRYREGVGSILDLLNAQSSLALARAEDVRARTDFLVGLAQLARATGRLDLPSEPSKAP